MLEPAISRCSQLQSCALWRILDTTRHLAAPIGVDEILHKTLASALQVLNADRGSVFLYNPKTHELYTKVAAGLRTPGDGMQPGDRLHDFVDAADSPIIRFPADKGIAGETAQKRRLINVPDCYADPRFNRDVDRQTGYLTRCLLSVPLLGVDEALAHPPMSAPAPVDMQPGDIFALISDGFFEFSDHAGEQFGNERVEELIRSHRGDSLEEIRRGLCEAVQVFAGDSPQADDMTIVLARRLP